MSDIQKTKLYMLFNTLVLATIVALIWVDQNPGKGMDIRYFIAGGNALLLLAQFWEYRKMCLAAKD